MKKVIALALALVLALSMTAMADSYEAGVATVYADSDHSGTERGDDGQMYPGVDYHFAISMLGNMSINDTFDLSKYFNIKKDFSTGSALVDGVKFCGDVDNCIIMSIKENYTIADLKVVKGNIVLTAKKDAPNGDFVKGDVFKLNFNGNNTDMDCVSNDVEDVDGASSKGDTNAIEVANNTLYNVNTAGWVEFCGEDSLVSVKVRLPEDKKVFAYFETDEIEAIADKYSDLDADIAYYNFVAKPSLGKTAEISLQGDYTAKYHLYEYSNGTLTEMTDAKWNSDDGCFNFKATQLTAYVISDKALVAEGDDAAKIDDASKNPDTGANDVVGVAVALAVVSLVAAGAVSLKK